MRAGMSNMKKIKNQNRYLIASLCCILVLLLICYFGINSTTKGTSAINLNCTNGEMIVVDSKTYCCPDKTYDTVGYDYLIYASTGKQVWYCLKSNQEFLTEKTGTNIPANGYYYRAYYKTGSNDGKYSNSQSCCDKYSAESGYKWNADTYDTIYTWGTYRSWCSTNLSSFDSALEGESCRLFSASEGFYYDWILNSGDPTTDRVIATDATNYTECEEKNKIKVTFDYNRIYQLL